MPDPFLYPVLTIPGALLIGAISPGPSVLFVSRTAITLSRAHGLAAAAGIGLGGAFFGCLALLGLGSGLQSLPWLLTLLKLAGGGYLLYLAYQIWRAAETPFILNDESNTPFAVPAPAIASLWKTGISAFLTQISNPKTAIVYGSIFAALLPPVPSTGQKLALPPMILCVESGWYVIVAIAFSAPTARTVYQRAKTAIDRVAGCVMALIAIALIVGN